MLFELHAHSWYSKDRFASWGFCSPVELVKVAKARGMDGIAVTDHDSLRSWESLKGLKIYDFLIVPGEEISTMQGHLIALGIHEEIKPAQHFLETIDRIHSQGGVAVAPHPFDLQEVGLGERAQHADAVEVFNSMNLDHFSNIRAKLFANYHGKTKTAGSDAHTKNMIGRGITIVRTELDEEAFLRAIRNGRTNTIENYHPVKELANWYMDRISSNPESAAIPMIHNHNLFKHDMLKTIMHHRKKDGIFSRSLVHSLPYLSTAGTFTKSLLVNGPECLM